MTRPQQAAVLVGRARLTLKQFVSPLIEDCRHDAGALKGWGIYRTAFCVEWKNDIGPYEPRPSTNLSSLPGFGLLLKRDHVRAGQRDGVWFQGLVRQVRIARIQNIIETDGRLVVAAG